MSLERLENVKSALIGFRKIAFALLLLGTTTGLLVAGLLDAGSFALIWSTAAPALFASNLAEHIVDHWKGKSRSR